MLNCQHQSENRCDSSTGLARIAPMIDAASLYDRDSLLRLLHAAKADCVYCILKTIEGACGLGCVRDKLHLWTDYEIIPRPCLLELAATLASSQARMMRETTGSEAAFGLIDATHAAATDIYVAAGPQHSGAEPWVLDVPMRRRHIP
jgi:hypothetical protein